jgi:hypothetical protein
VVCVSVCVVCVSVCVKGNSLRSRRKQSSRSERHHKAWGASPRIRLKKRLSPRSGRQPKASRAVHFEIIHPPVVLTRSNGGFRLFRLSLSGFSSCECFKIWIGFRAAFRLARLAERYSTSSNTVTNSLDISNKKLSTILSDTCNTFLCRAIPSLALTHKTLTTRGKYFFQLLASIHCFLS